jgi:ABC-type nickel/cobalt efflux system permease component RcnA
MTLAALDWPEALVAATSVAALGLIISIAAWQIFRTGQTAIRREHSHTREVESLRAELEKLRAASGAGAHPGSQRVEH